MIKKILQLIVFIVIFTAISAYQELGMLAENGEQSAPYFSLPRLEDPQTSLSLSDLSGQQTVVYFFAPWCSICKFSMPNLDKLHKNNNLNAVAIALDYDSVDAINILTGIYNDTVLQR